MSPSRPILVVDDDAMFRRMVALFLRSRGFAVVEACDGVEALAAFAHAAPRAIVTDQSMPRLGGLAALARIRARSRALPVVMATGDSDPEVHRRAAALGATVLLKPFPLPDLLSPLGLTPASAPTVVSAAGHVTRTARDAWPVLVVDDDTDIRALLTAFLGGEGFEVVSASDAETALRTLRQLAPAAILLDIALPGVSGMEALPGIRSVVPDVPVIMLSGKTEAETMKQAIALGAYDFIAKPVDFDRLRGVLDAAVASPGR